MSATATYRCDNCAGLLSPDPGASRVECAHCGATLEIARADAGTSPPADALSPVDETVLGHLRAGQKLEAIRSYRMATNVGLVEAKNHVEALEARYGLASAGAGSGGAVGVGVAMIAIVLLGLGFWLMH